MKITELIEHLKMEDFPENKINRSTRIKDLQVHHC